MPAGYFVAIVSLIHANSPVMVATLSYKKNLTILNITYYSFAALNIIRSFLYLEVRTVLAFSGFVYLSLCHYKNRRAGGFALSLTLTCQTFVLTEEHTATLFFLILYQSLPCVCNIKAATITKQQTNVENLLIFLDGLDSGSTK